ncbi:class I SAM-dependent methyltransferase [Ktedonosporobacter rubrisoli]|uniref:Class I SAM-dependent methyltransferase n=1 Tax=Ktedonosporobacter rubrisoli TaxID=2509675 RepID=A0A4P6JR78_KTERU|nr:class I SAM-dependent methyltransferase [Ktedonosporobacter rubrisoli]QBD77834.1 class I SAM-dependent methyltransferase [Ktedonosporobacter rubrisoli]
MRLPPKQSKQLYSRRQNYFIDADSGAEIARQMRQEMLITPAMGGLFVEHPDLSQVDRILDIYCGPGSWSLELAYMYPEIEVVGIDTNRNMIDYARAQARVQGLENVYFQTMNPKNLLDFPDGSFDIVNARFIAPYLYKRDWPAVLHEFARVTCPGGIIRLTEFDEMGLSNSAACNKMARLYAQALHHNGQSFHPLPDGPHLCITPMLAAFLEKAGCQNIQEKLHALNYSVGSEAYHSNYENLKVAYKLGQPFLLQMEVATQQELDELYEQMLLEMLADDFHAIWYFLTVWGYKSF